MTDRDVSGRSTEVRYGLLQQLKGLQQTAERPVLLSELLRYVHHMDGVDNDRVQRAIEDDANIAEQYRMLLASRRLLFAPRLAAASSNAEVRERRGDGFTLKLRQSKANADQVYVILDLDELVDVPATRELLLHIVTPHTSGILTLPAVHDSKSQCILHKDHKYIQLLRDEDAEISLL